MFSNCYPAVAFLNNQQMSPAHNYINPSVPFPVNGVTDQTSQRFFVRTRVATSGQSR